MATTKAKALITKGVLGRSTRSPAATAVAGRQTDLSLGPYPAVRFDQATTTTNALR